MLGQSPANPFGDWDRDRIPHRRILCRVEPGHERPCLGVVVVRATVAKATERCDGRTRPRFPARLMIPRAARADSEYLTGTACGGSSISVSSTADDEHSASSLRHSEVLAVENPPCHAVPDVGHRSKQLSEVPTAVRGEEPWYILDEHPAGSNNVNDSGELKEQP